MDINNFSIVVTSIGIRIVGHLHTVLLSSLDVIHS